MQRTPWTLYPDSPTGNVLSLLCLPAPLLSQFPHPPPPLIFFFFFFKPLEGKLHTPWPLILSFSNTYFLRSGVSSYISTIHLSSLVNLTRIHICAPVCLPCSVSARWPHHVSYSVSSSQQDPVQGQALPLVVVSFLANVNANVWNIVRPFFVFYDMTF